MTDADLRAILAQTRTVALVGFSARPERPSHDVAVFLQSRGYRVIPVNPGLAGKVFGGETVHADLASIPRDIAIDMVDVFRASEAVPALVDEILIHRPEVRTLWLQLGVTDATAENRASAAGLRVVVNRCPKIEIPRLGL